MATTDEKNNKISWKFPESRGAVGVHQDGECLLISFTGDWTVPGKLRAPDEIVIEDLTKIKCLRFICDDLQKWNNALVVLVCQLKRLCDDKKVECDFSGLPEGVLHLYELSASSEPDVVKTEAERFDIFYSVGKNTYHVFTKISSILGFVGELFVTYVRLFTGRSHMRFRDLVDQLAKAGYEALPIVSLISFLMGLILAFVGSIPLKWFSAEIYVASLVGIGMLRMMVPIMVGIVMAGRTGAAFAAELGTMQVNEELDALQTLGINPMEFLVLPRNLALTIMMPILCIYADIVGIFGGKFVAIYYMGLSSTEYRVQLISTTNASQFIIGVISAFVFGVLVSACGCYHGIKCGRDAEAVGQAATSAVVSSIVCLVVATAIITFVTVRLGV